MRSSAPASATSSTPAARRNTVPVVTLHEGNGKLVKVLKDNVKLQAATTEYGLVTKEFFTFTTPGAVELRGWMMKPRDFDAAKKYPVLMMQYSGPNSNEVLDQWDGRDHLWHTLLAHKGYIVVCVDPRGTGHRGKDFRHITYGAAGQVRDRGPDRRPRSGWHRSLCGRRRASASGAGATAAT